MNPTNGSAKYLQLFEVKFPIADSIRDNLATRIIVEATDFGDAEQRVKLCTPRKPDSVELLKWTVLFTHFDYIAAQDREEMIENAIHKDEEDEKPF